MVSSPFPQRLLHLYERHGRQLPPMAQLLLVVLLGVLAARWFWALMPVPEAARWQPIAATPAAVAAPARTGADVGTIVAAQLFGRYEAQATPGAMEAAPDTRLSLTLIGILAGTPEQSLALIANANGEEKPYGIGDDVAPGTSLQAIFTDRVILSRNGQLETLRLNRDAPSRGNGADMRPSTPAGPTAMLGQIREQILADPTKASSYIRVQPANVNGQLRGYRVYPGREREAFTDSGLRPGDLVTAVNGVQLDDNQKALQLLGDLSRASSISVTVERGGQQQNLNFSFN